MIVSDEDKNRVLVQVERLSALTGGAPLSRPYVVEIASHFTRAFETVAEVRRAVDAFVRNRRPPVPDEVWHMAREIQGERTLPWCAACDGTGWRIVTRGGVEGAERCPCRAVASRQSRNGDGSGKRTKRRS